MNLRLSGFEINRDIAVNRLTIQKIFLDHLALVSKGNDKFVDAMNRIDFHDVLKNLLLAHFNH